MNCLFNCQVCHAEGLSVHHHVSMRAWVRFPAGSLLFFFQVILTWSNFGGGWVFFQDFPEFSIFSRFSRKFIFQCFLAKGVSVSEELFKRYPMTPCMGDLGSRGVGYRTDLEEGHWACVGAMHVLQTKQSSKATHTCPFSPEPVPPSRDLHSLSNGTIILATYIC